jgi:hypothetical protein
MWLVYLNKPGVERQDIGVFRTEQAAIEAVNSVGQIDPRDRYLEEPLEKDGQGGYMRIVGNDVRLCIERLYFIDDLDAWTLKHWKLEIKPSPAASLAQPSDHPGPASEAGAAA